MTHEEVMNRLKTIKDWTSIILEDCRVAERDLKEMLGCVDEMIEFEKELSKELNNVENDDFFKLPPGCECTSPTYDGLCSLDALKLLKIPGILQAQHLCCFCKYCKKPSIK